MARGRVAFRPGALTNCHDVGLAQFGRQNVLDIGLEGNAADKPIDHERRDEAARRQRAAFIINQKYLTVVRASSACS
jgi:hypothetical protein